MCSHKDIYKKSLSGEWSGPHFPPLSGTFQIWIWGNGLRTDLKLAAGFFWLEGDFNKYSKFDITFILVILWIYHNIVCGYAKRAAAW